jgi:hypothetical protein
MIDHSQLQRFHRHLLILQQCGFDVGSRLLKGLRDSPSLVESTEFVGLMQVRLSELESLFSTDGQSAADLLSEVESGQHSSVTSEYLSAFRRWQESGEQLSSLEPLVVGHQLAKLSIHARRQLQLNLVVYLVFGVIALSSITSVALPRMRDIVGQLMVEPPWLLGQLLSPMPIASLTVLVLFLCGVILVSGWIWRKPWSFTAGSERFNSDWRLSRLSGRLATQTASLAVENRSGASFLAWASDPGCQPDEMQRRLTFAERLYNRLSWYQCQESGRRIPQMLSVLVGGLVTLTVGFLLFAPLVQLLRLVVDTSGLGR